MTTEQTAEKLLHTIQESTCAFTTARYAAERLKTAGFAELSLEDDWDLEKGGKYYVNVYDYHIPGLRLRAIDAEHSGSAGIYNFYHNFGSVLGGTGTDFPDGSALA